MVYVSGMQGVIATIYIAEDLNQIPGEKNPKPVCLYVEIVMPEYMPERLVYQS